MRLPAIVPRPRMRAAIARWMLVLVLGHLTACATHRHAPPECKGPYTPINQTSAVVSNGPQR
jgi:hypothetical protein